MFTQIYPHLFLPLAQGFILCAGLIIVVGPQNLFLLQQGLRRRHRLLTALLCTLFDLVLITLGVGGLGLTIAADERLVVATTLGGTAFLFGYGVRSLCSAWYAQSATHALAGSSQLTLKGTLLATLSFSFLNPAAYVDTVLMIGTTSSRYPIDERLFFGAGAVMASALWFFTLAYGSSRLTPLFRHGVAWRTLDLVSGCVMVGLGASLSATQYPWFL